MLRNHVSALPVVRNGEYLGLITQATVVGHCAITPLLVPRQVNGEVLGLLF